MKLYTMEKALMKLKLLNLIDFSIFLLRRNIFYNNFYYLYIKHDQENTMVKKNLFNDR